MFSKFKRIFHKEKRPELHVENHKTTFEQLKKYDTQFLIDDSGSMTGLRWTEARSALMGIAKEALRYDADGVEVHFLNALQEGGTFKTPQEIERLFDSVTPSLTAATPTGNRIEQVLSAYVDRLEAANACSQSAGPKPLNLIVITDGAPSDDPESVIVAISRRLEAGNFPRTQVGIQFIQVGNDKEAKQALKELDKDLKKKHGVWDIVDTRPYTGQPLTPERLLAMLLGGIDRRVDKLRNREI